MGCLPSELCERLTVSEFEEAKAYLAEEPLDPAVMSALAEILASLANGAMLRKDKQMWKVGDFLPQRWVEQQPEVESAPSPMDFMAALRARRG